MSRRPARLLLLVVVTVLSLLLGGCRTVTQGPQLTKIPEDDAVLPIQSLAEYPLFPEHRALGGLTYQWVGEPYAQVVLEHADGRITREEVEAARDREAVAWLRRYGKRDQVLPPTSAIAPIDTPTIDGRPAWGWFLGPGEGRPNARRRVIVIPWDETSTWILAMDCPGDGMTREEMETIVGSFLVADRQRQDLIGGLVVGALAAAVGWLLWRARRSQPRDS